MSECGTAAGYLGHLYRDEVPCGPCRVAHSSIGSDGCGTIAGYGRHVRRHERPCDRCRLARREWHREYRSERGRTGVLRGYRRARCGTLGGRSRHYRLGEEVCSACRQAMMDHVGLMRSGGYAIPNDFSRCGTNAGYQAHWIRGETTCPACREAHNVYNRARKELKRHDHQ